MPESVIRIGCDERFVPSVEGDTGTETRMKTPMRSAVLDAPGVYSPVPGVTKVALIDGEPVHLLHEDGASHFPLGTGVVLQPGYEGCLEFLVGPGKTAVFSCEVPKGMEGQLFTRRRDHAAPDSSILDDLRGLVASVRGLFAGRSNIDLR